MAPKREKAKRLKNLLVHTPSQVSKKQQPLKFEGLEGGCK
jgi:hypothetical protein